MVKIRKSLGEKCEIIPRFSRRGQKAYKVDGVPDEKITAVVDVSDFRL